MAKEHMNEMPTPHTFFLESPLYTSFKIDASNFKDALRVEFFQGTLDTYCLECGRDSVFTSKKELPLVEPTPYPSSLKDVESLLEQEGAYLPPQPGSLRKLSLKAYVIQDRVFKVEFDCIRDPAHRLYFIFRVMDSRITKIGQHPSLADLQSGSMKIYRKALAEPDYSELNRAVGLSAHGIGIGAFVYLRRILERLIENAHAEAAKGPDWDEESFEKGRIAERIPMLKGFLPDFMVKNRAVYAILSKGIHELTEDECMKHFEILRVSVELILDQKIERQEREKKIARATKELGAVRDQLGGGT